MFPFLFTWRNKLLIVLWKIVKIVYFFQLNIWPLTLSYVIIIASFTTYDVVE